MTMIYALLGLLLLVGILLAIAIRAAGGNIGLVDHWTKAFKHYSTYALTLVAFLPEIFNEIVTGGFLDGSPVSEEFSWINKATVLFAFLVMKIKQAPKAPDLKY